MSDTPRIGIYQKDHPILRTQLDAARYLVKPTVGVTQRSLQQYEDAIVDQGPTSSCMGHGTSQALTVSYAAAGQALPFRPSPKLIYELLRILDRQTPAEKLQDVGAMPARVPQALSFWGIQPMVMATTADGRVSDVDPSNVNDEPRLLELETSGLKLVTGEYRVNETSSSFADMICAAIAGGQNPSCALGIGLFVDTQNFMAYDGSMPVDTIDISDPQGGGHWLALDYFYTDVILGVVFGGPNSWGPGWGKNGHYEITARCLQRVCSDCYLFNVNK
jgi:hypothetical protein